jgi:hypothetical protein
VSAPKKLIVFAAGLAAVFGGAALAGGALPRLHKPGDAKETMSGKAMTEGETVRGLAVSDDAFALDLARRSAPRGTRFELAFRILDTAGRTVRDFDVEHTKRMHFIVVRRDLTGFQHLHPTESSDGRWSIPVTLPAPGTYRVFADFSVDGKPHTLADDLQVEGNVTSRGLPAPVKSADVDGLHVRLADGALHAGLESELGFTVTRNGRPVAIEDYLGAKGHLVALREGDLAYLHVHPDENSLGFMATFPTAGSYRLFLQFKVHGRVHTASFTQEVVR